MIDLNGKDDKKKGRLIRLPGMMLVLAAIILIIMSKIWPLVPSTALATVAVLLAIIIATVLNFFYERRKR